jgi:Ca2+-binding RTX toxin-like protein
MVENTSTTPARATDQTLNGTTGTDSLSGGGGNDTISGGDSADVLSGDAPLAGQWQYALYTRNFTGAPNQTPLITSGTLQGRGYVDDFNVLALRNTLAGTAQGTDQNDFGIIYTSTLNITTGGSYTFSTTSDDGSRIIIRDAGGNVVFNLNNDAFQAPTTVSSSVTLTGGQTYTIEVLYWEDAGGSSLSATIDPPGPGGAVDLTTSSLIGVPPVAPGQIDGNDSLLGGAGNDTLFGGGGNDRLFGGSEDDSMLGGDGADFIDGSLGADQLFGGLGNDTLQGGSGNDTFIGADGNDSILGDDGDDALFGGADSDSLGGGAGNDLLDGGEGNDQLIGASGTDTLLGAGGNDTITDSDGSTSVDGGLGNDSVSITGGVFNQTVLGGEGDDIVTIFNAIGSLNQVFGGTGNDSFTGGDATDSVFGGDGNDVLQPGNGSDFVDAGAGADSVSGFGGNDTILGGTGNDLLSGGTGADSLVGGDDRDLISFLDGDFAQGDIVFGGSGGDDFDTLDVSAYGWQRIDLTFTSPDNENGTITFFDTLGNIVGTMTFTDIEALIPCFTTGTLIATMRGALPVESLCPGDMVMTRDHGLQPVRWMGQRHLSEAALKQMPELCPIRIARGAMGSEKPDRDMSVSPQHRVLFAGAKAELLFAEPEVLVAAKHLLGMTGIAIDLPPAGITYVHVLFDRHEVILSDGIWTESFQPAERIVNAMDREQRDEVLRLFPEISEGAGAYSAVRPTLKAYEAQILLHR